MRFMDLEPKFMRVVDERTSKFVETIAEADGVFFLCPKCLNANGGDRRGVHSIGCWRPRVAQSEARMGPGRWEFEGTGLGDITFRAGSSSVLLMSGCRAHFFVTGGQVIDADGGATVPPGR